MNTFYLLFLITLTFSHVVLSLYSVHCAKRQDREYKRRGSEGVCLCQAADSRGKPTHPGLSMSQQPKRVQVHIYARNASLHLICDARHMRQDKSMKCVCVKPHEGRQWCQLGFVCHKRGWKCLQMYDVRCAQTHLGKTASQLNPSYECGEGMKLKVVKWC